MPNSILFLWMLVYPGSLLVGGVGAVLAYRAAGPRDSGRCGDLAKEGWRIYALAAAVPGLLFGAQVYLWFRGFDAPPPFLVTGILAAAGLALGAVVPGRLLQAFCRPADDRRHHLTVAAAVAACAFALAILSPMTRQSAWSSLVEASDDRALAHVSAAKGYGYASLTETVTALDAMLETPQETLHFARLATAPATPQTGTVHAAEALTQVVQSEVQVLLDRALEDDVARRLEGFISSGELGLEAVPVIWSLLQGRHDDQPRTIAAYAQAAEGVAGAVEAPSEAVALRHGLEHGDFATRRAFLAILGLRARRAPLDDHLRGAVADQLEDEPPLDQMAATVLLRDGSRPALRMIMPLFTEHDAPAWDLLLTNCPRGTQELRALTRDEDRDVARGARSVLDYVRQYCVTSRPVTG